MAKESWPGTFEPTNPNQSQYVTIPLQSGSNASNTSSGRPIAPSYNIFDRIGNWFTGKGKSDYNRYIADLADYDMNQEDIRWQRQVDEDWKRILHEEEINSIGHQIAEYEKNGLSKNLIYGSGNGGFIASQTGATPSYPDLNSEPAPEQESGMNLNELLQIAQFAQSLRGVRLQNDLTEQAVKGRVIENGIKGLQEKIIGRQVGDLDDFYSYQGQIRNDTLRRNQFDYKKIELEIQELEDEKDYRKFLRKYGLNQNDPALLRLLARSNEDPRFGALLSNVLATAVASIGGGILRLPGFLMKAIDDFNDEVEDMVPEPSSKISPYKPNY